MKLVVIGGGGFRVPLIVDAVQRAAQSGRVPIDHITLFDRDERRLLVMAGVLGAMEGPVSWEVTTDMAAALAGAHVVFTAVRIGGTAGRAADELNASAVGLLGQETIGVGGLTYGIRSAQPMRALAEQIDALAPGAWTINFTNPAGMITQVMREVLGDRVIGICDTPISLVRQAAEAAQRVVDVPPPARITGDYLGINHLGWLRGLHFDGTDVLPQLLANPEGLARLEESAIFGADWISSSRSIPSEYLHYYDIGIARPHAASGEDGRGVFLHRQQGEFYDGPVSDAARRWQQTLAQREATYMQDARTDSSGQVEHQSGGYHEVAVDLMAALLEGRSAWMILNVRNGLNGPSGPLLIEGLAADDVVEAGVWVDSDGVRTSDPQGQPPARVELTSSQRGVIMQVRASERLAICAARQGSRELAWHALASHPLVNSPQLAQRYLGVALKDPASGLGQVLIND